MRRPRLGKEYTSEDRVTYWLKGQSVQNFGDCLSEILFAALAKASFLSPRQGAQTGDFDVIHLIGSCISAGHINRDLEYVRGSGGKRIAFWGCGLRDDAGLPAHLIDRCAFLGVRGPLTRDALGLPRDTPIGDPGLMMPWIMSPVRNESYADKTVCVPHFLEQKSDGDLLALSHCQVVLRPNLAASTDDIYAFVDALVSARFVLAGALHAAIIACAFGKPFAYFDSGYIDVPFKWSDFAASIEIPCVFARNLEAGTRFYDAYSQQIRRPALSELLSCAPYRAPRVLRRALRDSTYENAQYEY